MAEDWKSARCAVCGAPSPSGDVCHRCATRSSDRSPARDSPPPARPSGIILEGKYRLLDEIGRGGMGTVFRAIDESLDRMVAVKFLLPEHQAEPALVARFQREAKAMASVRHENVLQIYSFGSYGATSFFVMEYIEGETADEMLEAALGRREVVLLADVVRILDHMCGGLAAVHRAGVVHRDIKPGNVMVHAESRRAVIMDFGIGRRYLPGDARQTVAPGGTPAYMAPEVIAGKQMDPTGERLTDVYAFGVTAFELATGCLPFVGETWVDVFQKHLTDPPRAPSGLRPGLPTGLDDIVLRCLAKAPEERFGSFDEIREALAPFVAAGPATPTPRLRRSTPAPSVPRGKPSGIERRDRIVVADPDPSFRTMVYQCAEDVFPGCRFRAARSTTSALEIAHESPPRILVAPLEDPELNGLEFAASLRADSVLEGVTVILTAVRLAARERRMLEELGVFSVLVKPVEQEAMTALLRQVAAGAVGPSRTVGTA